MLALALLQMGSCFPPSSLYNEFFGLLCVTWVTKLQFTFTDPNDKEARESKVYYEGRLSMMQEGEHLEEEEENEEETESEETEKPQPKEGFMLHYERLCRGESNKV